MTDAEGSQVVRKWQKPVFTLLARIIGQPEAVEELAQRTFVEAYLKGRELRDQHDFGVCVFRIATKAAIEFLRTSPGHSCAAIDMLSPEERALIVLAEIEKLPVRDLCYVFGISPKSLAARIAGARSSIGRKLPGRAARTVRAENFLMSCG